MQSPGNGTVLHWQPADVHFFDTEPSLLHYIMKLSELLMKLKNSFGPTAVWDRARLAVNFTFFPIKVIIRGEYT